MRFKLTEDIKFKKSFHAKRKEMFNSKDIYEMGEHISELLKLSKLIDKKDIYAPMHNFELVRLELVSMLHGIENWPKIKEHIISNPRSTQKNLITTEELNADQAALFLYRAAQFGILQKEKVGRNNSYKYITEKLNTEIIKKNWDILWEIPYQYFSLYY